MIQFILVVAISTGFARLVNSAYEANAGLIIVPFALLYVLAWFLQTEEEKAAVLAWLQRIHQRFE